VTEQLTLDIESQFKTEGVLIPKDIVSPSESKKKMNSEEFNLERANYLQFVEAIQSYHDCSFLKARELFFEHRDKGEPIHLDTDYFF